SQDRAVLDERAPADMAVPAHDRVSNDRLLADPRVGPDDGSLDGGIFFDVTVAADHAVRSDAGARLDDDVLVDETGRFDGGARFDTGRRRHARARTLCRKRRRVIAVSHDVAMHLHVFFWRADINPVAAIDVGDEGLVALDERREKTSLDRPRLLGGDPLE